MLPSNAGSSNGAEIMGLIASFLSYSREEAQQRGDICIVIADSLYCIPETNTIVKQLHPNKKIVIIV